MKIKLPKTPNTPDTEFEWKVPQWSNAIERNRARVYFIAYAAAMAMHFVDKALQEVRSGNTKVFEDFDVPDEGIGCGFHEAVRGVLSHHLVIQDKKIANYHPYPPDAVERQPDRLLRDARALRGCGHRSADLRGERPGQLPRYRHHARGPLVRSVPAVRRAHVPRWRQDAQAGALADVRRTAPRRLSADARTVELIGRVEGLLEELESLAEPAARDVALETVQAVLELYGAGLERIVGGRRDAPGDGAGRPTSSSSICCSSTACIR